MTNETILNGIELSDEALDSVVGGFKLNEQGMRELILTRDFILSINTDDLSFKAGAEQVDAMIQLFNGAEEPSEEAIIKAWKAITDSSTRFQVRRTLTDCGMDKTCFYIR